MPRGFRMGVYVAQTSSDTTVVQYTVDTNEVYYEEFSNGYDVLTPTTFTPTKTGYTFHGWRMDLVASSVVLSSKIATGGLIRLYAVFKKAITVTYYNNSSTAETETEYTYYNNANELGAGFTLAEDTITDWTPRGWTFSAVSGGATIEHQNGVLFRITADETLYGCYERTVTVSYDANGGSGDPMDDSVGTAYKHSIAGDTNANIVLSACEYESPSPKIFLSWKLNSPTGTMYTAGSTYSDIVDAVMYAFYEVPATETFDYTGTIQTFNAIAGVTYFLKLYGAQGAGPNGSSGGKGGYTYGLRTPVTNETWYVGVGGQGLASNQNGGYNGGGKGYDGWVAGYQCSTGGGGGASHVGLSNNLLKNTVDADIIAVAGGGGGGVTGKRYDESTTSRSNGGTGGGTSGGNGGGSQGDPNLGKGATQTTGYAKGQGGGGTECYSGGGGGYYGAYMSYLWYGAAGGGSGYTGGLTDATMENGQRSGNGQVIIGVYIPE